MDIVRQLEEVAHISDQVFSASSCTTPLEAEKVSSLSNQIISMANIWRKRRENAIVSPTWRALFTLMEHTRPELFERMEADDALANREASNYLEQKMQQILHGEIKIDHIYQLPDDRNRSLIFTGDITVFRVNETNIYIGAHEKIIVCNRWTGQLVRQLNLPRQRVCDLQLNERVLVVSLATGSIAVYHLATLQFIQMINDQTCPFSYYAYESGFYLGSEILVNLAKLEDGRSLVINVRQWDPVADQFGRRIEKTAVVHFGLEIDRAEVYSDANYLIVDVKTIRKRVIKILDVKSLNQTAQKSWQLFRYPAAIKKEVHDGVVVLRNVSNESNTELVTWNLADDTVQLISDSLSHCSHDLFYSAAVNNNAEHQFMIFRDAHSKQFYFSVFPVEGRRPTSNPPLLKHVSKSDLPISDVENHMNKERVLYFDGVQFITVNFNVLIIVDFVD